MIPYFKDENYFLSNKFPTIIATPWGQYKNAEAAFQAAKCADEAQREMFKDLDGFTAEKLGSFSGYSGRRITVRSDWNNVSYDIMCQVITAKFANEALATKLLATGEEELIFGNNSDRIWGAVWNNTTWEGENRLGKILMSVRQDIRDGKKAEFQPAEEEDQVEKTWRWVFSQASVKLSNEQKSVIRQIVEDFKGKKVTRLLVGNAGVGKTTVLYVLTIALSTFCGAVANENMAICAPTNKAARVLIEKGLKSARTIHDVFLSPTQKGNSVTFDARNTLREPYKFVVVDEASMVDDKVLDVLDAYQKDFGTNFLFVGDNFQLPPVKSSVNDAFSRYSKNVYALTKVFRQAQGSEILDYATALRIVQKTFVPATTKGQVEIMGGKAVLGEYYAALKNGKSAVAIVHRNDTRNRVNALTRAALGHKAPVVEGEHVICVTNVDNSFQNGEEFELHDIEKVEPITVTVNGRNQNGFYVEDRHGKHLLLPESDMAAVYHQQVQGIKGIDTKYLLYPNTYTKKSQLAKNVHVIYYGYAITAHKSQGSQWDEVYLLEIADRDNATRWLYTAVTRAAKRLVIFTNPDMSKTWTEINNTIGVESDVTEEKNKEEKNIMENKTNTENITVTEEENKEEIIVKKVGIILAATTIDHLEVQHRHMAVATFKNNAGIKVVPKLATPFDFIMAQSKKQGLKDMDMKDAKFVVDKGHTFSFGMFERLQMWYTNYVKNIDIAEMLGDNQLILCKSFQAAGIKANLEAAGYEVRFDVDEKTGTVYDGSTYFKEWYNAFTRKTNANTFKVAENYTVFGAGTYTLGNGTVVSYYREGRHMSRILLPIKDIDIEDTYLDATYFEVRGAIVANNMIVAFVYLLVMASARDEAIGLVNAWASRKWGNGASLCIEKKQIPVAYLANEPCCRKLMIESKDSKTARDALNVLKEARRTSKKNYLYAGVQAPVKTQAPAPKVTTADIDVDTIKDIVKVYVDVAVKPFVAANKALTEEVDALKKENVELRQEIECLKSFFELNAPFKLNALIKEQPADISNDEENGVSEEPSNPPVVEATETEQEEKPENDNGNNSSDPLGDLLKAATSGASEQPAANTEKQPKENSNDSDGYAEDEIEGLNLNDLSAIEAFNNPGDDIGEEEPENGDDNSKAKEGNTGKPSDENPDDDDPNDDGNDNNPSPSTNPEPPADDTKVTEITETVKQDGIKAKVTPESTSDIKAEVSPNPEIVPTGNVKIRRKRNSKKDNGMTSLFDNPVNEKPEETKPIEQPVPEDKTKTAQAPAPSEEQPPVLTETPKTDAPVITPVTSAATPVISAADIKLIQKFLCKEEPHKFGYLNNADYDADVKAYNASLQAAVDAAAIFGVTLKEMDKMTIKLLDGVNDSCTFSDIKVENGEVFVMTSETGDWQKLTVITKGTKKAFSLK